MAAEARAVESYVTSLLNTALWLSLLEDGDARNGPASPPHDVDEASKAAKEVERICAVLRDLDTPRELLRGAVFAAAEAALSAEPAARLERRLMRASGGALLLLEVMRAAPTDAPLQRAACRAVRALSAESATAPPVQFVRKAMATVAWLLRALPSDAETVLAGVQLAATVLAAHPEEERAAPRTPPALGRDGAGDAGAMSDVEEEEEDGGEGGAQPQSPAVAGAGAASGRARLEACDDFESSGSDTEATDAAPGAAFDGEAERDDADDNAGHAGGGERSDTPPPSELLQLEPPSPLRRAPPQGPKAKQVAAARAAAAECGILAPLCAALGSCAADARVQAEGLQLFALIAEHVGEVTTPGTSPHVGSPKPAVLDSLLGSPPGRGRSAQLHDVTRAQLAAVIAAAAAATSAHGADVAVLSAAVRALAALARNPTATAAAALRGQHAASALAMLERAGEALGSKLPRQEAAEALAALRSAPPPLPSKRSALHVAVALGLPRAVRALMLRGADASVVDAKGDSPGALAAKLGLAGVACAHQLHVAADAAAAASQPSSPLSPLKAGAA